MNDHTAEIDARLANLCCGHAACQREVRKAMAQAWDEAVRFAWDDEQCRDLEHNPYRNSVARTPRDWGIVPNAEVDEEFRRHLVEINRAEGRYVTPPGEGKP